MVGVLSLLAGCGDGDRSCTAAGCVDGFSITALSSEGLPAGGYEVQLTLDETLAVCTHPLLIGAPQRIGTCSVPSVRSSIIIHDAGAPGTGAENAFTIDIAGALSLVVVRVLHDGELIAEGSYEPAYQTIMPNGPECGPTCNTAPPEALRLDFE